MKPKDIYLDPGWLAENYSYDHEAGEISYRKTKASVKVGDIAGSIRGDGYLSIQLRGRKYLLDRVAWFMHHGKWPNGQIDHINRIRSDNRISNLRDVDQFINGMNRTTGRNNKSGKAGVQWRKHLGTWQATIRIDGFRKSLGHFSEYHDAVAAREKAEAEKWAVMVSSGEDV